MRFNLWRKSKAGRLPRPVQQYMSREFDLLPEYLDMLKCFEYDRLVNQKQVRRVRILSPCMAQEHHLSITTNLDLEQHPEMLLYEGYIDSQGSVYVADRRAPVKQKKAI